MSCPNQDGDLFIYRIIDKPFFQSVTLVSSYSPTNNETFPINLPLKVISKDKDLVSNDNLISTIDISLIKENGIIFLDIFNLDKKTLQNNTIYNTGQDPELFVSECE